MPGHTTPSLPKPSAPGERTQSRSSPGTLPGLTVIWSRTLTSGNICTATCLSRHRKQSTPASPHTCCHKYCSPRMELMQKTWPSCRSRHNMGCKRQRHRPALCQPCRPPRGAAAHHPQVLCWMIQRTSGAREPAQSAIESPAVEFWLPQPHGSGAEVLSWPTSRLAPAPGVSISLGTDPGTCSLL